MLRELRDEAYKVVQTAAPSATTTELGHAFMRYLGQGHEIAVPIPPGDLGAEAPNCCGPHSRSSTERCSGARSTISTSRS